MILVSEAESGKPPRIFHIRESTEKLLFSTGNDVAVAEHFKSTSEMFGQEHALELFSQRGVRLAKRLEPNRSAYVEASVETAAAVEATLWRRARRNRADAADGKAYSR